MQPLSTEKRALRLLLNKLILGLAVALLASPLHAQDDPFGSATPVNNQGTPNTAGNVSIVLPAISPDLPKSTQLIIRSVRKSDPSTALEFGRAIKTMLDIQQYDQARYYLSLLPGLMTDDAKRFEFQQVLGSDFLFEIQRVPELQPEGREFALQTFAGAKRAAYEPARIDKLIRDLSHPSRSIRGTAFRQLRRLGAPATAAMISVFADESRNAEFPAIRGAVRKMGESAIEPLTGAARANNARVQVEALRALTAIPSVESADAMFRAYLSPRYPESLRRSALDSLSNHYRLKVDPAAAEASLYKRAYDLMLGRSPIPESDSYGRTLWRWNDSSNRLESWDLDVATIVQIRAADRAADLYEVRPDSGRYRTLYLLTQLESSKRLLGPSNSVEAERFKRVIPDLKWQEVNRVLALAMQLKLKPAACGACELLAEIGTTETVAGRNGDQSNLIKALLSGNRHLQYSAFQAITRIDPTTAYNGSSYVMAFAAFMAAGGGQKKGLVGHQRPQMAQSYSATLSQTGYLGIATSNSREFFNRAISDPDLCLLIISDSMAFPDSIELAQQMQNDWRTRNLPVAILVSSEDSKRRMERVFHNHPHISIFPFTLDPQLINVHVRRLDFAADRWPVTPNDRQRHAFAAMNWLGKISDDRKRYAFYELGRHETALTRLIYVPGFSQVAAKILAALGTPAAQREMVNFASQSNLPFDERKQIADAFIQSVYKSGTLLTTSEIQMQYDRYNASEYEPQSNQELLGSILDAIEARARVGVDREN